MLHGLQLSIGGLRVYPVRQQRADVTARWMEDAFARTSPDVTPGLNHAAAGTALSSSARKPSRALGDAPVPPRGIP